MESDNLTWLCAELGLPAVMESDRGVVPNRAAIDAGCNEHPPSLEVALLSLVQLSSTDAQVSRALQLARSGEASALTLGGNGGRRQRLIATPRGFGRALVVLAAENEEASAELSRRASLVDVAAAVSHEVANAVAAIAGWAQLATTPGADVSADEALKLIASCARTAQQAAQGMLSLARGEQPQQAEDIDLSELSRELLSLLSLTARQARVRLTHHIDSDIIVEGSRAQLFTVLWNLTKNAIEACGPSGSVAVQLGVVSGQVQLEVRDTGAGLDPDELARIFTAYYTTKTAGTGLGLALVRKATADLGGEVTVQSIKGRGTTFRVRLPRAQRTSQSMTVASVQALGAQVALSARILVVDDDDALREMIATALSLRGADVVSAKSSAEARAAEGRFDIALIDMMLDEYRGDELLAALRRRGTVSAAMLVTGTVQKPRLVPGGEPDDWVRKPFDLSLLVERIHRTLDRHSMLNSVTATVMR
jgi:signal transduction histidine kinase